MLSCGRRPLPQPGLRGRVRPPGQGRSSPSNRGEQRLPAPPPHPFPGRRASSAAAGPEGGKEAAGPERPPGRPLPSGRTQAQLGPAPLTLRGTYPPHPAPPKPNERAGDEDGQAGRPMASGRGRGGRQHGRVCGKALEGRAGEGQGGGPAVPEEQRPVHLVRLVVIALLDAGAQLALHALHAAAVPAAAAFRRFLLRRHNRRRHQRGAGGRDGRAGRAQTHAAPERRRASPPGFRPF